MSDTTCTNMKEYIEQAEKDLLDPVNQAHGGPPAANTGASAR